MCPRAETFVSLNFNQPRVATTLDAKGLEQTVSRLMRISHPPPPSIATEKIRHQAETATKDAACTGTHDDGHCCQPEVPKEPLAMQAGA